MRSKLTLTGLALAFPMMCLTACTAIAPAQPPAALLQACPEPVPPADHTLGGLVQSVLDYQTALDQCNDKLTGLRAYYKTK